MTDESGTKVNTYSCSPRGVTRTGNTSEKVAQPYQFAGGYQDVTGLYHYAARYYDPNIGRFTQPDPSGQEQNPYLYAAGDPVNRIDPNGQLSLPGFDKVVGWAENAKSFWGIGSDLVSGDTVAAARGAASLAGGFVVGAVCEAATGPESGFLSTAGCYAAGTLTSKGIEKWLS